jgi:hypothetical protein
LAGVKRNIDARSLIYPSPRSYEVPGIFPQTEAIVVPRSEEGIYRISKQLKLAPTTFIEIVQ